MEPSVALGLNLTVVGMTVVFLILSLIALLVQFMKLFDRNWKTREKQQRTESLEKPQTIDDLTLILIAATVATMVHGRHRIRSVKRVISSTASSPWSMQGRSTIFGSHTINKGPKHGA